MRVRVLFVTCHPLGFGKWMSFVLAGTRVHVPLDVCCDPSMGSGKWMFFVLAGTREDLSRGCCQGDGRCFHLSTFHSIKSVSG